VRKVMVAAHELGLADRFDCVGTTPERVVADVGGANPLGQVPTLVLPDGATVYDSAVIVDYLDELAGGSLVPRAGPDRIRVLTLHALGQGLIDAAIRHVQEVRRAPAEVSRRFLDAKRAEIGRALDQLEKTPLDATRANIATIAIAVGLSYIDFRMPDEAWRSGRPALTEFYRRFAARPSMAATTPRG
jgi:glutathione S-transferase